MTHWLAWSAAFSAFIALAALAFERAAARLGVARRFVWIAAMLVAVVVPVAIATRVAPVVESPRLIESPVVLDNPTNAAAMPVETRATIAAQASRSLNWRALAANANHWIGAVWLGASLLSFTLLFRAVMRLRRRRHSWHEVETDAGSVLVSNDDGPAVIGFVQPKIVIPRWALTADHETRELLLLHEREHLRANDSRVLFGAALLLALVPWNAALWWMSRRLRLAIEIDCDARVIRASNARHSYGHMLITVGERYAAPGLGRATVRGRFRIRTRRRGMVAAPRTISRGSGSAGDRCAYRASAGDDFSRRIHADSKDAGSRATRTRCAVDENNRCTSRYGTGHRHRPQTAARQSGTSISGLIARAWGRGTRVHEVLNGRAGDSRHLDD